MDGLKWGWSEQGGRDTHPVLNPGMTAHIQEVLWGQLSLHQRVTATPQSMEGKGGYIWGGSGDSPGGGGIFCLAGGRGDEGQALASNFQGLQASIRAHRFLGEGRGRPGECGREPQ